MNKRITVSWVAVMLTGLMFAAAPALAAVRTINSCTTIINPGSYKLTKNVNGRLAAGDCIVIDADFVTLDLNGFTVGGAGTLVGGVPTGDGIAGSATPHKEVVVRNGVVTGFIDGIDFLTNSVASAEIRGVRSVDNTAHGIRVGQGSRVVDCVARDNGATGIYATGGVVIRGNITTVNTTQGIFGGINSIVTGNMTRLNSDSGIRAGPGSTVIGNVVSDNGGFGIALDCPSFVNANIAQNNTFTDINISGTGCESSENVPAVALP